ncbi:hypothetical protein MXB_131 [Myxobolus squamalis]|nr:hypothetical protein MXB_131 [Myxobolus squamalis]
MSIYDFIDYDWNGYFNYVYYKGSMALPPCYESVTWIISTESIEVQWEDIKPWTKLKGAHVPLICNNYRPLQNLNGRTIYFFDEDDKF